VASYRDRLQPELLRFPGLWRTRILIGAGLFAAVLISLLVVQFGAPKAVQRELAALALFALALLAVWPREIVCGPGGVEQRRIFWLGKCRIPWDGVLALEEKREFGGVGARLGLATGVIAVVGGRATIRHTPRHPDPERFLRECRMRMEEWELRHAAAGRQPAPPPGRSSDEIRSDARVARAGGFNAGPGTESRRHSRRQADMGGHRGRRPAR
jgi:hypothetical protein